MVICSVPRRYRSPPPCPPLKPFYIATTVSAAADRHSQRWGRAEKEAEMGRRWRRRTWPRGWCLSIPSRSNLSDSRLLVVHPADLCFKLPENVSLEEGAMCEPLSVGIHACRRANVGSETNVLIMGAGPIGLVTMLAARAFGAPRIIIVDVDGYRLSVAKSLGADDVVKVSTSNQDIDEDVVQIQKAMGSDIDVSFDCAGFSKTMSTALNATRAGGKVCLVGMGHNEMTVPLTPAAAREVDVVGIFRYKETWPLCIEFLRSGKIDVKPLITHRFGFSQEEVVEAFEVSARGGDAIKVMFNL
ncbi:L-idonate 5-dehydrogenase isoform X2 [Musa acuminata AAA Group]|uniref:L-idonate 5-dehydrogenase isoform X2 n=1 Tax=Musa acuminata AAA Group TaxID=214697 RepID=UPI0031E24966